MSKVTFNEYVKEVMSQFGKYKHSAADTEKYFNTSEVKSQLQDEYNQFVGAMPKGHTPQAVAYCLEMLYE